MSKAIRRPAVAGRRVCAVFAAGSAALHALSLGHADSAASAALMVVMIAACLNCARRLWVRGAVADWTVIAVMNLAMIAVHLPAPAHHHGGIGAPITAMAPMSMPHSPTMQLATLMAAVEAVIASAVVFYRTRVTLNAERAEVLNAVTGTRRPDAP